MSGRVYLVGAGPGDPGLLTARALELIAGADVVLHDRLIPQTALDGARPDAELLFVGKQGDGPSVAQQQTEAVMVDRARAGKTVVRLKGGDPFVFGRGGEEALALRSAGIPFEVVPGVTAGIAALAYAGIPATYRGLSGAVALVTGRSRAPEAPDAGNPGAGEDGDGDGDGGGREARGRELDWQALAAFPGTLVFYMSVARLAHIASSLIDAGREPGEPATVVQDGTLPSQRSITASLGSIADESRRAAIGPPAILAVGQVVALAEQLGWVAPRVLAGRTVTVTRAREQASALARRLQTLGATVVQAPVIGIQPIDGPALDPAPYDLICLTSPNGVERLFERLAAGGRDARSLAGARVAAIGQGTAAALARRGIVADIVPERAVAEGLVDALAGVPVSRALVARAKQGRDVLPAALRAQGAAVDELALFETVPEPLEDATLARAREADYITFTSSSTVRHFLAAAGGNSISPHTRIVSIGPITSGTLREHGLTPHVEATRHDVEGVIDALVHDAARDEPRSPR